MFMGSYLFVILVPSGICYFRYFAYEPILKIMFIIENDQRGLGSMHIACTPDSRRCRIIKWTHNDHTAFVALLSPNKQHHICFAHSFHTFLRNLLKHTSKDSQIHGDLLTPPPDSVTCPWRSRCHVLEVGVPEKCTTFKSGISQKLCT